MVFVEETRTLGLTSESLAEIRAHHELLQPPTAVIPRRAWRLC